MAAPRDCPVSLGPMAGRERTRACAATLVVVVTAATSSVLAILHVPSAVLFGAVLGGMAHALTSPVPLVLPPWTFLAAHGLIGVTIGALVEAAALKRIAAESVAITLLVVATILLSILAGLVLALRRGVSTATGVLSMIAGGASGVVVVAHELGADDRVVTVVQFLRVLVVLATLPVVMAVVFDPSTGGGFLASPATSPVADLAFVAISLAIGSVVARLLPVTAITLLGPLAVAAVLSASGWLGQVVVPTWLQWLGFALVGVQVGLRFTRSDLRTIRRMLPTVLVIIVAMIAATAGMGGLLAWWTPVDGLTAYLATTPGGMFAVLATAADAGSDVTYVMAFQLLRLLLILAALPLLARWLRGRP